jgi:aryl-alcohol dehydrogenase-like predicted oxidoreductase
MIGLEDCIAMCGLEPDEVAAICEHEHIGTVPASALASYLLHQAHGGERIRTMIIEDIHEALDRGEVRHAAELVAVLRHFLQHHPDAAVGMTVE